MITRSSSRSRSFLARTGPSIFGSFFLSFFFCLVCTLYVYDAIDASITVKYVIIDDTATSEELAESPEEKEREVLPAV